MQTNTWREPSVSFKILPTEGDEDDDDELSLTLLFITGLTGSNSDTALQVGGALHL